jgi:methionine-rich copper-binding protein CopC
MSKFLAIFAAAIGLFVAVPAQAHSQLESSIPADRSTVTAPKTLSLTFTRELRLVTVKLLADGVEESLDVDRSAAPAKSFTIPLPAVAPGTYTVKWRAAATDGHIMTGSFMFTVAADGKTDQTGKP